MRDGFGLSWIVSKQRGEGAGVREPGEEGGSVSTVLAVDLALGLLAGFLCVRGRMRMMEYWVDEICRDMDCNSGRTTRRCGFRRGGGGSRKGRRIGGLLFLYTLLLLGMLLVAEILVVASAERLDYVDFFEERKKEAEELVNATTRLNNATTEARPPSSREGSIAEVFDELLEREFPEKEDPQEANEGLVGSSFNNSVNDQQAVLETVARVTHDKPKKNDTQAENATAKPFHLQDLIINRDAETGADQLPTLIDKKDNVFVISNPREGSMVLQQDVRFISDLVLVIVSAAGGGIAFACLGQPVITGYLLAGSAVGPGGFSFVSELVQVETVAQFGVVFLLFALGLEFSMSKLRVVRAVAVIGGFLQIALFMCLCSLTAVLCGAKASEGIFVGAFLSMSSTAVVLKFLMDRNGTTALHGQVTIGTLILQDCAVGLLFALLPVLGDTGGVMSGLVAMSRSLFVLAAFIVTAVIVTRSLVTRFFKLISSQTNELYQLASVAFCLLVAWISDKLGLSLELGAFVAGVMISTTEFAEHTLEQVEPIRNLFASLFLASIGMLINIQFLWAHMDILVASLILVIVSKTIVVTVVVRAFGYSMKNAFLVGMSLAQIGEFAFILLSRASNLHLIQKKLYLLLVGTTALSLVTTPLLFRAIPAVLHLGSLMRWIPPDSNQSEVRNVVQCLSYARGAGEENGMVKQNEQKWSSSSCCASMWLSIKEGSQWKRAQRRQACSSTTPNST